MKTIFGIIIFALCACQFNPQNQVEDPPLETADLVEYFVDSTNIGRKSKNKIEISVFRNDSFFVVLEFYSRQKDKWLQKNKYTFETDAITGINPIVSDYNNDGFKELTYVSAMAARAANQVRRLFIYDNVMDELILIRNSEHYPNLLYNSELSCIDAFMIYAGSSTVFLRIQEDSLKEFASVDLFDGLFVKTTDSMGKERTIYHDSTYDNEYIRFINYNPLKQYPDSLYY